MSLRRKARRLVWGGLVGGFVVASAALATLHFGLIGDRENAAAAIAASVRREAAIFSAMVEQGDLTLAAAQKLARAATQKLGGERFRIRIGEAGSEPLEDGDIVRRDRFPAWDWSISVSTDTDDIYGRLLQRSMLVLVLFGGLILLSWRAARHLIDRIIDPMETLAGRMRHIANGGTGIDIPGQSRPDEIGMIARSLEQFRRKLNDLHEHDERLSGIMASTDEAILVLHPEGQVRQANGAARRLFGRDTEESTFADLFLTDSRQRIRDLFNDLRAADDETMVRHAETMQLERDGERIRATLSLTPLSLRARNGFVAILHDVTEQERTQREMMRLATRDRLTGLANRSHFEATLEAAITRAWKQNHGVAVLCFDISRFKLITDTLGHRAGDALLIEVGRRLRTVIGNDGTVGRLGIDDFAVLLDPADETRADAVAKAILASFNTPIDLDGTEHFVRPALGFALFPRHATTAEDLLRCAETAVYAAKRRGGLQSALYEPKMGDQARRHLALDQEMRRALGNGEFLLHYQPKVSLVDFSVEGFEALLRWNRPGIGLVAPGEFLGVAEDTGFIASLDEWVLDEACRQLRAWTEEGLSPLPVAVNVSPHHLRRHDVVDFQAALARHGVSPSLVEIEVTENAVMQDLEHALKVLQGLKDHGISVAVDDFGTGHSSLSYLKQLPVSTLKIDRSFVSGLPKASDDAGIVATIISMADLLKLKVVAEGVERPEQAQFLRSHNCILAQGWLTGRPMPAENVAPILATRQRQRARA